MRKIIFDDIQIGTLIHNRVTELQIEISRICNFFKKEQIEIEKMYTCKSLDTDILLKWSKLLEYDFFRIYTQHLILYSPPSAIITDKNGNRRPDIKRTQLPQFRKNIYMIEMIEFILELIESKEKTRQQVMDEYKIPKTTLYKWISKYDSRIMKKESVILSSSKL